MSSDLPMFITAVEALVVHDGKILTIVRSSTDEHAPGTLTFPAGKVEYGEDMDDILESTVIREVEEETGVIVDQPQYLFSRMFKSDTGLAVVLAEFVCHYAGGEAHVCDLAETDAVAWLTEDEIRRDPRTPVWTQQVLDRLNEYLGKDW